MSRTVTVFLTVLCFLLLRPSDCRGSKILVMPVDGSHWINMKVILEELHSRGHEISVLRQAKSWFISSNSSMYTTISIPVKDERREKNFYNEYAQSVMDCRSYPTFIHILCQLRLTTSILANAQNKIGRAAANVLDNHGFVKKLQDSKFDLMLTDPSNSLGVILGRYLKLPIVFNVRLINGKAQFIVAPSPVSYVPVPGSELDDNMDFVQRTKNMLYYLYSVYEQYFLINPAYSDVFERHFPPGTDLLSLQLSADIWLFRTDFVFDFPRPTMPNVVYIGGFQCKQAKPLTAELEAFMQSSGEHGVVVMSLGTLVSALPPEVTEAIAAAFGQLPQKVIWKFEGEKPSSLGNNTLLVNWLPQKDLLGHPKTRVFVTHGGTNAIYETIYHGVPVLGMPLFFDQFDNLLRLKVRGAAQMVEVRSLTKENFLEALKDLIENPSYRKNIQHLSLLYRDRPISPLDEAIFWIEYVIRNKGAAHLKSAGFSLPWYTYFCLDVAALFMVVTGTFIWGLVLVCRRLCCRFKKKMKAE
ncbi:UDP-glucuronosyltransferase 2B15-like [Nematolebias whitei]|uniref:UDP-glucuronosyltransferase 2B15-like n=1 Tax=Nematolebias whitei TaxID=451745 RepID=UPI001896BAEB|nr:UDP-glucuronosyltransferase 2B15-like [Nematolebias whitei]